MLTTRIYVWFLLISAFNSAYGQHYGAADPNAAAYGQQYAQPAAQPSYGGYGAYGASAGGYGGQSSGGYSGSQGVGGAGVMSVIGEASSGQVYFQNFLIAKTLLTYFLLLH